MIVEAFTVPQPVRTLNQVFIGVFQSRSGKTRRHGCAGATKTCYGATYLANWSQDVDRGYGLRSLENDLIAHFGLAARRAASRKFQRLARAPDDRRETPRPQIVIDPSHPALAIQKDHVDGKTHEQHVHAHEWLQPSRLEQHPRLFLESITAEQAATFAGHPTRIFKAGAEHGRARLIYRSKFRWLHCLDFAHRCPSVPFLASRSCPSPREPATLSRRGEV